MMMEQMLEQKLYAALNSIGLSGVTINQSRGAVKTDSGDSILAIAVGCRVHDNFSLSPITIPVSLALVTKVEKDPDQTIHNSNLELILDKISYWHKNGDVMTEDLTTEKCSALELKCDGGSSSSYDKENRVWNDVVTFTIRGAEKFPVVPVWGTGKYQVQDILFGFDITAEYNGLSYNGFFDDFGVNLEEDGQVTVAHLGGNTYIGRFDATKVTQQIEVHNTTSDADWHFVNIIWQQN